MKLPILRDLLIFYSSYFTKKDKNIWVFGAIRGQKYSDNARYLFEHVNQHTKVQAIWISRNSDLIDNLTKKGFKAFLESSPEALHYASRAKIAIVTHRGNRSKADLPFHAFNRKTKIIQLWHGIPLKKIAYDDTIFSFQHNETSLWWQLRRTLIGIFLPFLDYVNKPSLILALSNETKMIFEKAFRVRGNKVVVLGYPRNDTLLDGTNHSETTARRKVIYAPTFRGTVSSRFDLFLQFGFDTEKLEEFLASENMMLDIKLHPFNNPSAELLESLKKAQHINFLETDDIYQVLGNYDYLITDYSSIYFDYLLLERPIIFSPFDMDLYTENDREFYYNYDQITPGPKAKNWDEVIRQLAVLGCNNELADSFARERISIKNKFHYYHDNKSSERVCAEIMKIAGNG